MNIVDLTEEEKQMDSDFKDLLGLAATGPVTWIALFSAWYEAQENGNGGGGVPLLVIHALRNYVGTFVMAVIAIDVGAFVKWRGDSLGELRTSTSTTLDDLNQYGAQEFVIRATELFNETPSSSIHPASYFEAPTVIRYKQGQSLAPHYNANRSADVEDTNRDGQTLSTRCHKV